MAPLMIARSSIQCLNRGAKLVLTDMSGIELDHDYSRKFHLLRPQLIDGNGIRYDNFIKTLKPNYARIYLDITLGYAALIITMVAVTLAPHRGLLVVCGAVSVGFWIAYLQLFIHEGAHFNFSAEKEKSDFLCNIFIAWLIGTSVQQYRAVHFQHHRALGRTDDSEASYFFPLNIVFLAKAMFGVRVIEILTSRKAITDRPKTTGDGKKVGIVGIAAHACIVFVAYLCGGLWSSTAWIFGVVMFFPLFGALRQLLEHRDPHSDSATNYFDNDHGAYTRMFGSDLFSSIFGGAGFNRHLLHHWEPQVSYTNLPQLEAYLLQTEAAPLIEMRRSSYFGTFASLFRIL